MERPVSWEFAERVQKNDAGEFRALISGEWLPVEKAQKNDSGQFRIQRFQAQPKNIQSQEPAFEKEARQILGTTTPELIAGHPTTRYALGVAEPALALAQYGARNPVSKALGQKEWIDQTISQLQKMKEAGMKAYGSEGTDWMGVMGAVTSPPVIAGTKALQPVEGAIKKIGQSALIGGVTSAATTAKTEEEQQDFWDSQGGKTLLGMTISGGVRGGWELGKAATQTLRDVFRVVAPSGAERILTDYQKKIVGPGNISKVAQAARGAPEIVPFSKPTAAEAVAALPEGSPIQAHQAITAKTPSGISGQFGARKAEQKEAWRIAELARDSITGPKREAALDAANQVGGVKASIITNQIDRMASQPGQRVSEVVKKSLSEIKEKLIEASNGQGQIDAHDLYTIRKEVGNTIGKHAKESASWDKRLSSGLERNVQKYIDDAIEASGGKGWKAYLAEYAQRSQLIEASKQRVLASAKPLQRTELGGGVNVAEETRTKLPQMLSRPMMLTNFIVSNIMRRSGIEEKLDKAAAARYLDPKLLANELEKVPPAWRGKVIQDLLNKGQIPFYAGTAKAQE